MSELSAELEKDLELKWKNIREAAELSGVNLKLGAFEEESLKKVLPFSNFVASGFVRNPELTLDLTTSGDLKKTYSPEKLRDSLKLALQGVSNAEELSVILRRFRLRETIRIAWRDLAGWAELSETMMDLSLLAEACVDLAFECLHKWQSEKFGSPVYADGSEQKIVVLGMGKVGAWELNFSSDLDLIFAFPENGQTTNESSSISSEEFFIRLARDFLKVFSLTHGEGLLFRIDTRLRPFGENGPLIMSFDAMEAYYESYGREWERYALIKARTIAGDRKAGKSLLKRLKPFVYPRYLDYGSYETLREMKRKITLEIQRKKMRNNIKLGPGGIREVEFFGQIFQMARGGIEPLLQEPRILKVLSILACEGYITAKVEEELTQAYFFLRTTENRLQEWEDKQTHDLPEQILDKERLVKSMGYGDWDSWLETMNSHRKKAHFHFQQLLLGKEQEKQTVDIREKLGMVWQGLSDQSETEKILKEAGFQEPDEIRRLLEIFKTEPDTQKLTAKGLSLLDKLIPLILEKTGKKKQPKTILRRTLDLIKSLERRACYISLLLENPAAVDSLIYLAQTSAWIISFLALHPLLLDELLDTRRLYTPPDQKELKYRLSRRLQKSSDLELLLEEAVIFKNVNTLRVAAAGVSGAFSPKQVSAYLTKIAQTIVDEVLSLSWNHLEEKYGRPVAVSGEKKYETGFCVIGYGKLGGSELAYSSDLDLVFLHAGASEPTTGKGSKLDSPQFFVRLGQRLVHFLTVHTRTGKLYDIDMRLRPSGNAGILVSHIKSFEEYQTTKAWTWEHQALVRARPICGDQMLAREFQEIREKVLCAPRNPERLLSDIKEMRQKMRKEREKTEKEMFDIKEGVGGIVDIEFIVQYLVLLHARQYKELLKQTNNFKLLEILAATGVIKPQVSELLKEAYITYRAKVHQLNLKEKPAMIDLKKLSYLTAKVQKIWIEYFGS